MVRFDHEMFQGMWSPRIHSLQQCTETTAVNRIVLQVEVWLASHFAGAGIREEIVHVTVTVIVKELASNFSGFRVTTEE